MKIGTMVGSYLNTLKEDEEGMISVLSIIIGGNREKGIYLGFLLTSVF